MRHTPRLHGRSRFVFAGYRAVLVPPKSAPDQHTRRAAWLTRSEIARQPLRHPEVLAWIDKRASGAALLPTAAYQWLACPP